MRELKTNSVAVRLARQPSHHGSGLERDERLRSQDVANPKASDAAKLAAGHERLCGRAIGWTKEGTQLQCATVRLGNRRTVHLLVERLGETGWDWHVWVQADWTWAHYGLAETAENAREQAEGAFVSLMCSDTDGTALLSTNCQAVLFPQRGA